MIERSGERGSGITVFICTNVFSLSFVLVYQGYKKLKLVTVVEGDQKAPFLIATTPRCRGGATPFP